MLPTSVTGFYSTLKPLCFLGRAGGSGKQTWFLLFWWCRLHSWMSQQIGKLSVLICQPFGMCYKSWLWINLHGATHPKCSCFSWVVVQLSCPIDAEVFACSPCSGSPGSSREWVTSAAWPCEAQQCLQACLITWCSSSVRAVCVHGCSVVHIIMELLLTALWICFFPNAGHAVFTRGSCASWLHTLSCVHQMTLSWLLNRFFSCRQGLKSKGFCCITIFYTLQFVEYFFFLKCVVFISNLPFKKMHFN